MFHSSRTTLRELKKRYLNILKKCLLANLMVFSFCLSVNARTFETNEDLNSILLQNEFVEQVSINSDLTLTIPIQQNNDWYKLTKNFDTDPFFSLTPLASLTFDGGKLDFCNNVTNIRGGVIYSLNGKLIFKNDVKFQNNSSITGHGGSIYGSDMNFEGKALFEGNNAGNVGGAMFIAPGATVVFWDDATFSNNYAKGRGGALYVEHGQVFQDITFKKGATFIGNTSDAYGNAIIAYTANLKFDGITKFIRNVGKGGGIHVATNSTIQFNDTSTVYFIENKSTEGSGVYNWSILNVFGKSYWIGNISSGQGGAIVNQKKLTFQNDFIFLMNQAQIGNDIYNTAEINFLGGNGIIGSGIAGTEMGIINKSGDGLLVLGDQSENHEYEGAFTQTAGTTIANSERFFSHENAVNTINGGELKTHGAEIAYKATLGETGTLTHLGSSADTPTEIKGVTFNGTGLNLTLGTYTKAEQEKEIALVGDRLVEYVDDKGTEDTSDDELVSYQATDKLFTIKALENDQKAKFILKENLAGMDGNTLTIDNAELDVAEGLKVLGTVVAKDMTLSKGTTPVSFTDVEVATDGVLNIGTREMNVDSMTLQDGATLKIALNSLQEHGKVNGLITGTSTSQLALNLATDVEKGVYQLFDQDNDIALEENLFFNIKDLKNGAYQVEKKTTKDLIKDFGSENQAKAVVALLRGESSHIGFSKMQSEILEALQSGDKAQVQKAKKALKAIGKSEQSSAQAVASNHVGAVGKVVGGEMKGGSMKGHSGGDTDPRAKVYIKGLYDKTKSTMGDGFKARSQGAVLGVQSEVTETLTLGVGYVTSQTTAKEDLRRTEVDTNTGFISAHYQPNAWWLSGLATFSRGQYDEQKQILSSVGTANYDVDSWGVQVMTGYDIKLENAIITPEVGMRYLSIKQEGYTDTLGTTVEATSSDYLTAIAGIKTAWDLGKIRPSVGINVGYDVISDDVSALNTLANGASYTVNSEALDRLSVGVTTGVEAKLNDRTTLKLEYNGSFRKEYKDHSGMLKLELKF